MAEIDNQRSRMLHIDNVSLNGGDPLAVVEAAVRRMRDREQKRGPYSVRAVLLDADKVGLSKERDAELMDIVTREEIVTIWQAPCHEAFLLRHLPQCATRRPPTTIEAQRQLEAQWPEYKRPMLASELGERLNYESVVRAAAVERDLQRFLRLLDI